MDTLARDLMSTELMNATEGMTLEDTLKLLVNNKVTGLPVVDQTGKMVGVVSEYDVLVQAAKCEHLDRAAFQQPMMFSRKVDTVTEDTPLKDIVDRFVDARYRRLPVVDGTGKLVGIITRRDLMRMFYYRARLG